MSKRHGVVPGGLGPGNGGVELDSIGPASMTNNTLEAKPKVELCHLKLFGVIQITLTRLWNFLTISHRTRHSVEKFPPLFFEIF